MNVYVASSWRNDFQPTVVRELRDAGHQVYDFKNPTWNDNGFHWSEIDGSWEGWSFDEYLRALEHDLALAGFKSDMDALEWCDACVLVLPCGRSAHLELGWAVAAGKNTCVLHQPDHPIEPELMAKMCDAQFNSLASVLDWLA